MTHWRFPFAVLAVLAAAPALAETGPEGVMERLRPGYDAKGIEAGPFRLKPSLDVGGGFDDNVYRTETGKQSDFYYSGDLGFSLKTDSSRHMFELYGDVKRTQYSKLDKESRTDWNAGADSRIDLWDGANIDGDVSYTRTHEPRYSPDEPTGAAEPTEFSIWHSAGNFNWRPSSFGFKAGYTYDRFNYSDTALIGGGTASNGDRDHRRYRAVAETSYDFGPDYSLFLRGAYDVRNFDESLDRNGYDRDSNGWRGEVGARFALTHLLHGEIYGGYARQSFKDAALKDIRAIVYGASLDWYATELMTVHLGASRTFNDTTLAGVSATDDQLIRLGIDYEILRDLIGQASVGYTSSKFVGIDRTDKFIDAAFTLRWLINEYMSLEAGYTFSRRNSSVAGEDYTDNTVNAGLHFQI